MRIHPWLPSVLLFFVLVVPSAVKAQLGPTEPGRPVQTPNEDDTLRKFKKEMTKRANKERQQEIQRDTEKLLKLATELKEYVGKTNESILSVDVIKKADEIEKLAHDVKEKMKSSY